MTPIDWALMTVGFSIFMWVMGFIMGRWYEVREWWKIR